MDGDHVIAIVARMRPGSPTSGSMLLGESTRAEGPGPPAREQRRERRLSNADRIALSDDRRALSCGPSLHRDSDGSPLATGWTLACAQKQPRLSSRQRYRYWVRGGQNAGADPGHERFPNRDTPIHGDVPGFRALAARRD